MNLDPTFLISILIALSVHEWAHGFVANKLGDPTAEEHGRLTLNPIAHLDLLGTMMFLFAGFGWGKPVPVDPRYFRHPKRDTALVSLAGPASNFILAALSFLALAILMRSTHISLEQILTPTTRGAVVFVFFRSLLQSLIFINLGLMSFNLLPIAPLDGSKIVQAFVPLRHEDAYETFMRWGPYILIALLLIDGVLRMPILSSWIFAIMRGSLMLFTAMFGWLPGS